MTPDTLHATAIALGPHGVLVRGAAGAGKTTLARILVERHRSAGGFARFVADDRVVAEAVNGRLIASPPASIAGLAELRGRGVVAVDHLAAVVVRLIVDLVPAAERMPEADELVTVIGGLVLARQPVGAAVGDPATLVLRALESAIGAPAPGARPFLLAPPAPVHKR